MDWILTCEELPQEDGIYEVCNLPEADMGIAEYNGYGFIYCGIYRTPRFWRKSKRKEKIYGKIKNLEEEDLCSQNLHMWAWFPKEKSMCMRCGIVESNHILGSIVNT